MGTQYNRFNVRCRIAWAFVLLAILDSQSSKAAESPSPHCKIVVTEKGTGWPVPLVELRTVHQIRFVTDNAGIIAFDLPELMGKDVWCDVHGHGYAVPADSFGYRGVRFVPEPGKTVNVQVERTIVAKRIGRLTGAGLFAESQKLGLEKDWGDSRLVGCDSVQNAVHRGKLFWAWGDSNLSGYPLGIFDTSSATTETQPLKSFQPPLRLSFDFFEDKSGRPRGVAKMPGDGPTWIGGYVSLPDKSGQPKLVGNYIKVKGLLEAYESGLCVWNDEESRFERLKVLWTKSNEHPRPPKVPDGHPAFWKDESGREWVSFGNPFPALRCPPTFEAWQDPQQWEPIDPQREVVSSVDAKPVTPHTGSIAWNEFRKRWVTVFMEKFGKPSAFGELWYAESTLPRGPWGPAVKILSHDNYTFYNPRLHADFTPSGSPVLLFEGTYTQQFADKPQPTPRYEYNQILYRLDLDDPALAPARATPDVFQNGTSATMRHLGQSACNDDTDLKK